MQELWELTAIFSTTRPRGKGVKATNLSLFHPHQHLLCASYTHTHTLLNLFLGLWSQTRNECMTWTPNMTFFFPWQSCSGPSHDWILHKLDVLVKREILDSLVERTRLPVHLGFWFQPRVLWWFWQEKKIYSKIKAFFKFSGLEWVWVTILGFKIQL